MAEETGSTESLVFMIDRFSSVHLDSGKQTVYRNVFVAKLKDALVTWKTNGQTGVWITVPTETAAIIPDLIKLGFDFHHAQPGYVLLTTWLPDSPNNLPSYASHYVGVGGFVVNEQQQVLVIREKYHNESKPSPWKLPGGLADKGEDLAVTSAREVLEETGVSATFKSLIAFRHMHKYRFGCSDMYFVCLMKPLSLEINSCPNEIAECKWMDLDEYENGEDISDVNKFFVQAYKEMAINGKSFQAHDVRSYDNKSLNKVYSMDAS